MKAFYVEFEDSTRDFNYSWSFDMTEEAASRLRGSIHQAITLLSTGEVNYSGIMNGEAERDELFEQVENLIFHEIQGIDSGTSREEFGNRVNNVAHKIIALFRATKQVKCDQCPPVDDNDESTWFCPHVGA